MYLTEKQSYSWLLFISSWLSIVNTWSIMVEAASVTSLKDGVLYDPVTFFKLMMHSTKL